MQEAVSILKGFMQKNVAKRLGCIKVTIYALMGSYLVNAKFFFGVFVLDGVSYLRFFCQF